jgi:DNA-binding LacI/PurR family transcriptional regulator
VSPFPSERRVTAADIARSLGISRATVGFVLNDTPGQTISAATRDRVLAEAARLGYRPHQAARALASGQSRIVLLILPDWPLEYSLSSHLEEASLALDEAGYSLVTWTHHAGGKARPLWETLQPDVVMSLTPLDPETAAAIRRGGAVVVTPGGPGAPTEPLGYGMGPALQIQHLAERGHRRVLYAESADPRIADLVAERVSVASQAALKLGVTLTRDVVVEVDSSSVAAWVASGITAVAGYNDDIAARVLNAALRAGINVPGDLAVVGHDDAPFSRLLLPALSTVRVDNAGLGRFFAAIALNAATGAPAPTAGPETRAELIRRESA